MDKSIIDKIMEIVRDLGGCHVKLKNTNGDAMVIIKGDKSMSKIGAQELRAKLRRHGIQSTSKYTQDGWVALISGLIIKEE